MNDLQQILTRLNNLTPAERAEVEKRIKQLESAWRESRKSKLWDNVRKAIKEYQDEIDTIYIADAYDGDISLYNVDLSTPGVIEPYYDHD